MSAGTGLTAGAVRGLGAAARGVDRGGDRFCPGCRFLGALRTVGGWMFRLFGRRRRRFVGLQVGLRGMRVLLCWRLVRFSSQRLPGIGWLRGRSGSGLGFRGWGRLWLWSRRGFGLRSRRRMRGRFRARRRSGSRFWSCGGGGFWRRRRRRFWRWSWGRLRSGRSGWGGRGCWGCGWSRGGRRSWCRRGCCLPRGELIVDAGLSRGQFLPGGCVGQPSGLRLHVAVFGGRRRRCVRSGQTRATGGHCAGIEPLGLLGHERRLARTQGQRDNAADRKAVRDGDQDDVAPEPGLRSHRGFPRELRIQAAHHGLTACSVTIPTLLIFALRMQSITPTNC